MVGTVVAGGRLLRTPIARKLSRTVVIGLSLVARWLRFAIFALSRGHVPQREERYNPNRFSLPRTHGKPVGDKLSYHLGGCKAKLKTWLRPARLATVFIIKEAAYAQI